MPPGAPDKHGPGTGLDIRANVADIADPGLSDRDDLVAKDRADPGKGRPVDIEGLEVAGVDPDDAGPGVQSAAGLLRVVDLDQRGHPQAVHLAEQAGQGRLVERGDDEQDEVGAVGSRLEHLVGVDDEVLAQHRDVDRGADGREVSQGATEAALLGQDADGARPATGV